MSARSFWLLLAIAYLGFISLGLPDPLIGVAWPSVRQSFSLQQGAVAWVFLGSGLSYVLSSLFAGHFMSKLGVGALLALSSALVALGGFGFALAPAWGFFAACALFHGLGSGAIDSGLNHYAARHFSPRHMNWLHACYSLGATLGPLIMTAAITRGDWRGGYLAVACTLLALAALFAVTRRHWKDADGASGEQLAESPAPGLKAVLRQSLVWWHAGLFFVYTGLEFTAGQWSFTLLRESRGLSAVEAGGAVTGYYASIALGRIIFGFLVPRLGLDRLLRLSSGLSLSGAAILAFSTSASLSTLALVVVGLGLAPIFPCLMSKTPLRLGSAVARHAIGLQVSAAMIGGALLPSLAGFSAQSLGLESVAVITLVIAVVVFLLHERLLLHDRRIARLAIPPP